LRGPWECEPLARMVADAGGSLPLAAQPLPSPSRITVPSRWSETGLADFAGRVRYRRRFGRPRQVDPHERVWLTFGGANDVALVTLNERFLGRPERAAEPFEFDVTELLEERNNL